MAITRDDFPGDAELLCNKDAVGGGSSYTEDMATGSRLIITN